MSRYTLKRETEKRETPWGEVRVKKAEGYGIRREKPEYEDVARIAERENLTLEEVRKAIR